MAERRGGGDRERLRAEREAAEAAEAKKRRDRLLLTYGGAAAVIVVIAVAVVLVAGGGGGDSGTTVAEKGTKNGKGTDEGGAHINLNAESGSTNGVQPDERAGIVPPAVKVANLKAAAKKAGCKLQLGLKDEGHEHIAPGSPTPNYKTQPPTSGSHVEPPYQQADGAYSETPEPIDFVHSLEHGRMEIQYAPDLPEEGQLELKGLYDTMYGATLLFPNEEMPYAVAATTWTNLIGCPTYKGSITLDAIRAFGKQTWGKYGGEPAEAFTFTGPTPAAPESSG